MGCSYSFSRPPPEGQIPGKISSSTTGNGNGNGDGSSTHSAIRVVHMNGYVEDLLLPPPTPSRKSKAVITARDVIGPPPSSAAATANSSVLCSSSQLRSMGVGCFAPLPLDDALRPDELYFVLPSSLFHSDSSSSLDLVSLANRLAAIARDPSTPVDLRDVGADGWEGVVTRWEGRERGSWKPDLDAIEEVSLTGSLSRSSINPGSSIDPPPN